jgi:hypothetical protein
VDNIQGTLGVSGDIIPSVNNTYNLGNSSFAWKNVYVGANNAPVLDTVSGNIGYYARTAAEIAASVTPTNYSYAPVQTNNAVRYGADQTGVSQSSTALAKYFAASSSVVLNAGTYLLTSQLTLAPTTPLTFSSSDLNSVIKNFGLTINGTDVFHNSFSNLNFLGTDASNSNGMYLGHVHKAKIDTCSAKHFTYGLQLVYGFLANAYNCEFANNTYGFYVQNFGNSGACYSCTFSNNATYGAWIKSTQKFTFYASDFEYNGTYGLCIDASDNATLQLTTVNCIDGYFETSATVTDVYVGLGTGSPANVSGCVFQRNAHFGASKVYAYVVDHAFGTKIIDPDFQGASFSNSKSNCAIYLTANSQNTKISPFVASQVYADTGATVSTDTIQTGEVSLTLSAGGEATTTVNFPVQYYQNPNVQLSVYSTTAPAGSLGTCNIKNGANTVGFFVDVVGGPASAAVVLRWRAGA